MNMKMNKSKSTKRIRRKTNINNVIRKKRNIRKNKESILIKMGWWNKNKKPIKKKKRTNKFNQIYSQTKHKK